MGEVVEFRPKLKPNEIIKIVDGIPVRCINVDLLSPREFEEYFRDAALETLVNKNEENEGS